MGSACFKADSGCSLCPCYSQNNNAEEVDKRPAATPLRQQRTGGYLKKYPEKMEWIDHTFSCKRLAECSEEKRLGYFIFLPIMILSFIFGGLLLQNESPVVISRRYDDLNCSGNPCNISILLDRDMPAPIYFNYKLVNFYQSHRVYLNSKGDQQLMDSVLNTEGCSPSKTFNGLVIYPCGLLPQSIFTDRFFIDVERNGTTISLCPECPRNESDISWGEYWDLFEANQTWEPTGTWGGLADSKFKNNLNQDPATYTRDSQFLEDTELQLPYPENSDLIVWLRTATKPTFKKPFRVIRDYDLQKGDIVNVYYFQYFAPGGKGKKYFTLETAPGLGITTVVLAGQCLAIGIFSFCMIGFLVSWRHLKCVFMDKL